MGHLEMFVETQFIFLLCFSVFHVFYFIYFYMFEIKNSQMRKYFFGHGKIKLISTITSDLILGSP